MLSHLLRTRAGEHRLDADTMQRVVLAITNLCNASGVLAVELFCGGVLGCVLGIAQRLAAAQPHAHQESFTDDMIRRDLLPMLQACGRTVPQARAHSLPAPALRADSPVLAGGAAVTEAPASAQVARVCVMTGNEVSFWTRFARPPSLLHPASQHAWGFVVPLALTPPSAPAVHACWRPDAAYQGGWLCAHRQCDAASSRLRGGGHRAR